ncbi:DUF5706 domain-containing protein [Streptomyces sp. DSM 42041]|uniref:DUF5706 domain-containing protein n=1 Tax=Streptomyces hazeniae TaxID=3075538 RepID=A0ABU2NYG3_9ACTN|nr:Pycsar system effector family protein [Streptomyces sp. DSM 42041]MDT0382034.1 DUF5706 domain-containing protein [Streptomyces sp. DSM 42041]
MTAPTPPTAASGTAPPDADPDVRATALRLLADLRAETAKADTKASVLMGAQSLAAGILFGLLADGEWRPSNLPAVGTALWWFGSLSFVTSLGSLLMAVLPRYTRSTWQPGLPVAYFADISRAAARGQLARALADTARDPAAGVVASLTEHSRIVQSKHHWIRVGLAAFCTGCVLLPGALLIG